MSETPDEQLGERPPEEARQATQEIVPAATQQIAPIAPSRKSRNRFETYTGLLNNIESYHSELWDELETFEKTFWKSSSFKEMYPEMMRIISLVGRRVGAANRERRPTMFQESVPAPRVPKEGEEDDGSEREEVVRVNLSELGFHNAMDVMDFGTPEQAARLSPKYLNYLHDYIDSVKFDLGDISTPEMDTVALERVRPYVSDFLDRAMHHLEASHSQKQELFAQTLANANALESAVILKEPAIARQQQAYMRRARSRKRRGRRQVAEVPEA